MPIGISAEVTLRLMSMQRLFMYSAFVSLLTSAESPGAEYLAFRESFLVS